MRRKNLLTQVLVTNLVLMVAAIVATTVAANGTLDPGENATAGLVLGVAVAMAIAMNVSMIQRRFRPLERLVDQMERADLSRPGANLRSLPDGRGDPEEVERLDHAFRRMFERLEAERRRASSAALAAQEEERARVARDLHDEVNQALTGLLLRLEAAREKAPPELAQELAETKALANQAMEELLALSRQLRPTALDDHGLKAALAALVTQLDRQSELTTTFDAEGDFRDLPEDAQLVVYRVAQEALSNAARHAGASRVRVWLLCHGGEVELVVADDGQGFSFEQATGGLGLSGMRERALLVGGELQIESRPELGTRVRLRVPSLQDRLQTVES